MSIGSGAIAAGKGFVELFLKSDKLDSGLARSAKTLTKWSLGIGAIGASLTGLSATILTPLYAFADSAARSGAKLYDMSLITGTSVKALSELGFAAEQSGGDIDQIENALNKMNKTLGGGDAKNTLKAIGLTLADLRDKSPDEQFEIIAEAISKLGTQAQKTAALMSIFGRAGAGLGSLMANGAAGIQELRKEAQELGIVASPERAKAADEYVDAWNRFSRITKSIKSAIGSALVPAITDMYNSMTTAIIPVRDFIKANKEWIPVLFRVGQAIAVAGAVLAGLATAGLIASGIMAGLATISTIAAAVIGGAWAVITSPIFLVIAAVALLAAGFIYLTGSGVTVLAVIIGVTKALAGGQWALAGAIAMKGLEVVWLKSINYLSNLWVQLKYAMINAMSMAAVGVQAIWGKIIDRLKIEWAGLRSLIDPTFDYKGALKKIDKDRKKSDAAAEKAATAKPKDGELDPYAADIARAKKELDDLLAKVGVKKEKPFDERYPLPKKNKGNPFPEFTANAGTFSGFAALALGQAGPSVNEKIKEGVDGINEKLSAILGIAQEGGPAFGL